MLKLSEIVAEPEEIDIDGTVYIVEDPGMQAMSKMIELSDQLKDKPSIAGEMIKHFRTMVPSIPDDVFHRLTAKQMFVLMKYIGKCFMTSTDEEGKQAGPLSESGK
jgi:hypothetical protein